MDIFIVISAILVISNLVSLFFIFKKKKKQAVLTKDANALLSELLKGGAVVTVQVANPSEIFMWSPKDVS